MVSSPRPTKKASHSRFCTVRGQVPRSISSKVTAAPCDSSRAIRAIATAPVSRLTISVMRRIRVWVMGRGILDVPGRRRGFSSTTAACAARPSVVGRSGLPHRIPRSHAAVPPKQASRRSSRVRRRSGSGLVPDHLGTRSSGCGAGRCRCSVRVLHRQVASRQPAVAGAKPSRGGRTWQPGRGYGRPGFAAMIRVFLPSRLPRCSAGRRLRSAAPSAAAAEVRGRDTPARDPGWSGPESPAAAGSQLVAASGRSEPPSTSPHPPGSRPGGAGPTRRCRPTARPPTELRPADRQFYIHPGGGRTGVAGRTRGPRPNCVPATRSAREISNS
jgi:hypothetical protein